MASGIGGFRSFRDSKGGKSKPYRKHRPLPALIVICVLLLGAMVVWVNVLANKVDVDEEIRCEPAASPPPGVTFSSLPRGALEGTPPIPPGKVAVRVLNAGGMRGQASITTKGLRQLGFTQVGEPANDPAYQEREADCDGQVRFGQNGAAAARTVSLIDPCLELIKDNRSDASVDLVIGSRFGDVRPTAEGLEVLKRLTEWAQAQPAGQGGEQSVGDRPPLIDPALLRAARSGSC